MKKFIVILMYSISLSVWADDFSAYESLRDAGVGTYGIDYHSGETSGDESSDSDQSYESSQDTSESVTTTTENCHYRTENDGSVTKTCTEYPSR